MSEYLFVYGTLRPSHAPAEVAAIVKKLRKVGIGHIRGRLYDLGEYPGAILDASADTAISGEVFAIPNEDAVLSVLDSYEDFDSSDPENSLFVRKQHPVTLSDGRKLKCWVYVYNRDLGEAHLVTGGDYANFNAA
ncbi:MAG TPA: gamma-glutamylcyclotransferase family protein [Pyrinomonadaceae bacterium]|jgi:gamma-glutamylcyclotransferase (GGCT)/AIG2-like uncharacterized protein YtfP